MVQEVRNIRRKVLPNGLTVITEQMQHIRSASIGVWIKSGSREAVSDLKQLGLQLIQAFILYAPAVVGQALIANAARVMFSFHPGRDSQQAQTVKVTFSPAPEGARVVLTHSGWEKLSANAQQLRDSYDGGWESVFVAAYRDHVQNEKRPQGN